MAISLSDTRFTEREIRTIRTAASQIYLEARKEKPRKIRISNLCDRISATVTKAERRTLKTRI